MAASSPVGGLGMAEVSRERALRAELGEIRARLAERDRENALLGEENAALRETESALRGQLAALVERVTELERRLGQNPRNSHRPPSSEGYDKPAPRSRRARGDRKPGGQPGHEGTALCQVATPDELLVHSPPRCARCGASLVDAPVASTEARQVFDLPPIALRVVAHVLEHRRCGCGRVTMADPPAGIGAPAQYGPGVRALATYLLAGQHLPLARTAELLSELVDAPISEGSLARWYADAAAELDPFLDTVGTGLAAADVVGADETGARVDGGLAWIHAARTDVLTLYTVSAKRGVEAMRAAGVLPALGPDAVLVHDFWGPYWSFDVVHAVCGAHLLRELAAAADVNGQAGWARGIERLLGEINHTVAAVRDIGAD